MRSTFFLSSRIRFKLTSNTLQTVTWDLIRCDGSLNIHICDTNVETNRRVVQPPRLNREINEFINYMDVTVAVIRGDKFMSLNLGKNLLLFFAFGALHLVQEEISFE